MIPLVYRLALLLFPPAFRAAFGDCMQADFSDGLRDARRATRRGHLPGWLARVAWDLARSITRQWLRTSVPWLTTLYAITIQAFLEGLSATMLRSRMLGHVAGTDFSTGWYMTGSVLVVLGVSVLMFLVWFIMPNLRRDTPVSLRA